MADKKRIKKIKRIICIVLISLNSVLHLLGGAGTICVATGAEKYGSMAVLADYKWLYKMFVVTAIAVGALGIAATVQLTRRKCKAYRNTVIVLLAGILVCAAHMTASEILRGDSTPVNFRLYFNILVLAIFWFSGDSGLWLTPELCSSSSGKSTSSAAAGAAMVVSGLMILTVHIWSASVHTINGFNFADIWHWQLMIAGGALVAGGVFLLVRYVAGLWRASRNNNFEDVMLNDRGNEV